MDKRYYSRYQKNKRILFQGTSLVCISNKLVLLSYRETRRCNWDYLSSRLCKMGQGRI